MDSIEDIISGEVNGLVTSFVVIASYLDEAGENMLYLNGIDEQPTQISLGLIEFAKLYVTKKLENTFDFDM
jgi:hypothetical protein